MQLTVLDQKKNFQSGTSYEPKSAIYTEKFNEPLVHQTVIAILAGMRSGTAAQKNRSAVRGGGKKPWKQKGTGRARAGTIRSPLWRKGGVVFAATTQSYKQKLNKKSYKKTLNSIVAELFRQNRIIVISSLGLETHKTKELKKILETLKLNNALIITDNVSENLLRGSNNLINIEVAEGKTVNPLQLIKYDNVLIDLNGLKALEERLAS